jgi:hypothetical protein
VRSAYREYTNEMRTNDPSWRGFVMPDGEDMLITIGDVAA